MITDVGGVQKSFEAHRKEYRISKEDEKMISLYVNIHKYTKNFKMLLVIIRLKKNLLTL